jgi:hypothetical protein
MSFGELGGVNLKFYLQRFSHEMLEEKDHIASREPLQRTPGRKVKWLKRLLLEAVMEYG